MKGISQDPTYGYTKENPIKVRIGDILREPASEKCYLNSLLSETGKPSVLLRSLAPPTDPFMLRTSVAA